MLRIAYAALAYAVLAKAKLSRRLSICLALAAAELEHKQSKALLVPKLSSHALPLRKAKAFGLRPRAGALA